MHPTEMICFDAMAASIFIGIKYKVSNHDAKIQIFYNSTNTYNSWLHVSALVRCPPPQWCELVAKWSLDKRGLHIHPQDNQYSQFP